MLKLKGYIKGFTLIELMIVVAIICALAIVLIPQASNIRNNVKASGIEANARLVQLQCENVIDKSINTNIATNLKAKLITTLKNPFDRTATDVEVTTCALIEDVVFADADNSVYIFNGTYFADDAAADTVFLDSGASTVTDATNAKGVVVAVIIDTGTVNDLHVRLYNYGENGEPISTATNVSIIEK
ncbi:MAG: prepilin-type N-terminal cleavage/methylation domain-containing protein [Clostridiales bacterium]